MSQCFVCDGTLGNKNTRLSTNITPFSNVPYLEKISELLGEEFVIAVNSDDHMCQKCTSMLSHIDKLENDLKLVKNSIMSHIQNKYEILPLGQAENSVENTNQLNENLMANKQQNLGQFILPNKVPVKKIPTIVPMPVKYPIQILKIQPQQKQNPQQVQNKQQFQKQQSGANSTKSFKFNTQYVKLKKLTYSIERKPENPNPIVTQTESAEILTPVPQKKNVTYRCQLCFKSFDSRPVCVEHIQKEHKKSATSISNRKSEIKHSFTDTVNISNLHPATTQKNNQKLKSLMDIDNNEQDNKNGTLSTDMISNDNVPATKYANTELEKETDNFSKAKTKTVKEIKLITKSDPVKEKKVKIKEEEGEDKKKEEEDKEEKKGKYDKEDAAKLEKDTPSRSKKKVVEDSVNLKNKKRRSKFRKNIGNNP